MLNKVYKTLFFCYNNIGDNMLEFQKNPFQKTNGQIKTDYVKKTDLDRVQEIREKMDLTKKMVNQEIREKTNSTNINHEIQLDPFKDRINAIKNIKKD